MAKNAKMSSLKKYFSLELFFWIIALLYLSMTDPAAPHFSFCLFKFLGFSNCVGCGIGHSIAYLLQGDLIKSFETHWLGTFAVLIIVYRILQLIIYKTKTKPKNGKSVLTI